MRRPLVAGNWKMHGSQASARQLLTELVSQPIAGTVDVAVCPVSIDFCSVLSFCSSYTCVE